MPQVARFSRPGFYRRVKIGIFLRHTRGLITSSFFITNHANRKQRVLLTAAGIRLGQRLARENDLALVQLVRVG